MVRGPQFEKLSVEDYDTIKCLWKWKCIKLVALLWWPMYVLNISRLFLFGMKNVSDKRCRENRNAHFIFNNVFEYRAVYEIVWKNARERNRSQMAIWRMRIACWITTRTHSGCAILIAFPLQQGRIKLFGAPRQWKNFRPLFQAVFLSWRGGGYYPPGWVKHHASQSQDRNNKYFILYIEFCINNEI
jgi:hypothetical protein